MFSVRIPPCHERPLSPSKIFILLPFVKLEWCQNVSESCLSLLYDQTDPCENLQNDFPPRFNLTSALPLNMLKVTVHNLQWKGKLKLWAAVYADYGDVGKIKTLL